MSPMVKLQDVFPTHLMVGQSHSILNSNTHLLHLTLESAVVTITDMDTVMVTAMDIITGTAITPVARGCKRPHTLSTSSGRLQLTWQGSLSLNYLNQECHLFLQSHSQSLKCLHFPRLLLEPLWHCHLRDSMPYLQVLCVCLIPHVILQPWWWF